MIGAYSFLHPRLLWLLVIPLLLIALGAWIIIRRHRK